MLLASAPDGAGFQKRCLTDYQRWEFSDRRVGRRRGRHATAAD